MAWLSGYTYRKKLTIDSTYIDSNLSNFPILVKLTESDFEFNEAMTNGYDIRFTSSDGETLLDFEREFHGDDGGTDYGYYWVEIPSVSSSTDTEFYLYYGKDSDSNGEDISGTWNGYTALWHLKESGNGSVGEFVDSTSNNHDGQGQGTIPSQVAGLIYKGQDGAGTNSYISVPDNDDFYISGDFTLEWKMKWISSVSNGSIMGQSQGSGAVNKWILNYGDLSAGAMGFHTQPGNQTVSFSWSPSPDTWYNCALIRNGNDFKFYVDGTQVGGTQTNSMTVPNVGAPFNLFTEGESWQWFDGVLDEVRITNGTALTEARFKASYYSDTDNLISFGNEEQGITLSDNWTVSKGSVDASLTDTLELDDDWTLRRDETVYYGSRIITGNSLIFVTYTSQAKIVHIDISTPSSPVKSVYNLIGASYAIDVVLNDTSDYYYVLCADGKVIKVDASNLSSQTIINTGDSDNLQLAGAFDTRLKTYASTDDSNGEIIMIDESTLNAINTDIRWSQRVTNTISCLINTILGETLTLDVRYSKKISTTLKTDIRWLKNTYEDLTQYPISFDDIQVKINGTDLAPLDDVDLKSIIITHTVDNLSYASFTLHRRFDRPDLDNQGNSSQITNKNSVQIYIDGHLEFNGKVRRIDALSNTEAISVFAQMDEPSNSKKTVSIPIPSVGENLNPYHCLINQVSIENPELDTDAVIINDNGLYWSGSEWVGDINEAQTFASHASAQSTIDSDLSDYTSQEVWPTNYEANPEYYQGIQVNLGTEIEQQIIRLQSFRATGALANEVEDGEFTPKQNWSYFWNASFENYVTGDTATSLRYIGTSLGALSTDTWQINGLSYKYQKILPDLETDLGWYYVGSAPYKIISTQNGRLIAKDRWEDRRDGLYRVKDEEYDYEQYAKDIASLEYSKLQTINSAILPRTASTIQLTVDGYYFYDIKLLTRVNISNTTTSGVYSNNNGFPVSVKSITISTSDMTVSLQCNNENSIEEREEIDRNYPDVNSDEYIQEKEEVRNYLKFDPNEWGYIT